MAIKKQKLIIYFIAYLVIGFYFIRVGADINSEVEFHKSVIQNEKEQYSTRILFPSSINYLSNLLKRFSISYISDIARLYRIAYIFIIAMTALFFQIYLNTWFDEKVSLIGTLFLLISLPFSFIITGHLDAIFDLLLFTVGGIFILRSYYWSLVLIMFIGAFNRPTILLLSILYFVAKFEETKGWLLLSIKSIFLFIIPTSISWIIRYFRDVLDKAPYPNMFIWNLACHNCLISVLMLFHIFWILAFIQLNKKPLILQRWAFLVPFFIIAQYLLGFVWETRIFLSLSIILIPLGLFTLFPRHLTRAL